MKPVFNGFEYSVENEEVKVIRFTKRKPTIVEIPETIADFPVTRIADGFLRDRELIDTVTIPETVRYIGNQSFKGTGIKEIIIPDSVMSIGNDAFNNCEKLTKVKLSNHLQSIGDFAFAKCCLLEDIIIPDSVTKMGVSVFEDSGIKNVSLPDGINLINQCLFRRCLSLKTIKIPNSVTLLESQAFRGCSNLESLNFPDNLQTIETMLFDKCDNLRHIWFTQAFLDSPYSQNIFKLLEIMKVTTYETLLKIPRNPQM